MVNIFEENGKFVCYFMSIPLEKTLGFAEVVTRHAAPVDSKTSSSLASIFRKKSGLKLFVLLLRISQ